MRRVRTVAARIRERAEVLLWIITCAAVARLASFEWGVLVWAVGTLVYLFLMSLFSALDPTGEDEDQ